MSQYEVFCSGEIAKVLQEKGNHLIYLQSLSLHSGSELLLPNMQVTIDVNFHINIWKMETDHFLQEIFINGTFII